MKESYDRNNIFAKILRGESSCIKVYEDQKTLAFMDIMPQSNGHTLVIPKSPVRNLFDIQTTDLNAVMDVARKISKAQMRALGANGVRIQQSNETAAGQVIFHMHVHVIPCFAKKPEEQHMDKTVTLETLEKFAQKIASAL